MKDFIKKLFEDASSYLNPPNQNTQARKKENNKSYPIVELLLGKEKEENLLEKTTEGGEKMATAKDMEKLLAQVVKDNGLEGAVIADLEGLPLASYLPTGLDEDEVAAASAAILAISDSKLGDSGKGKVVQASIEAEKGYLVITPIKGEYVASVLAPKDAKLGIILSAVRSIEKRI